VRHLIPKRQPARGFGGLVLPMGVYVVKDDQVRWVPAYDATLIVLAGLSVVRVLLSLMKGGQRIRALRRAMGSAE
jgi:hypothetical protein